MAGELGWDEARASLEVSRYRDAVTADLAAQAEPDDLRAYQAATAAGRAVPFYGS